MIAANLKAVIYCRVSTKEQVEEGNSLITQEKICIEYAAKNGYQVEKIFIEQGESAKTVDRPQLQEMLSYCSMKKNSIKAIITYKIDRISRNTDDYSKIRILLKKIGVELKSTTEFFENNPVGRFLENTMASIAELDNSIRAERCSNGMREAVREGRYVWMAPVGYQNVKVHGKSTIAPSSMAPIILATFKMIADGIYPAEEVRKMMYKKGLTNLQGKELARSYFYRLIKNKLYMGTVEKFGEVHQGKFTPVVPEHLFNLVQDVLRLNGKRVSRYKIDHIDFPLRRFITHENGSKLRGSWSVGRNGHKYAFYRFQTLPKHNYKKEYVENKFMEFLDSYSISKEMANELFQHVREEYRSSTKDQFKEQEELTKQLKKLRDKENMIAEKSISGVLPDVIVKNQLNQIKMEETQIKSQLSVQEETLPQLDLNKVLAHAKDFITKPSNYWKKMSFEAKLELQRFVFPSGICFDGINLRTTQTAFIFKAKECFLGHQSSLVGYKFVGTKHYLVECSYLSEIIAQDKGKAKTKFSATYRSAQSLM